MTTAPKPAHPTTTLPEVSVPTFGPDGNADLTNTLSVSVTEPSSPDAVPPSKRHPEQREGELYMGNTLLIDGECPSSWTSKRRGQVAYDIHGEAVNGMRPWFILASEVEQAIVCHEADPKPWSAENIRVYRNMLKEYS